MKELLITNLIILCPVFTLIYLMFNGYPSENVSILIGLVCGIVAILIARKGINENYR